MTEHHKIAPEAEITDEGPMTIELSPDSASTEIDALKYTVKKLVNVEWTSTGTVWHKFTANSEDVQNAFTAYAAIYNTYGDTGPSDEELERGSDPLLAYQLLERAAQIIAQHGHCTGTLARHTNGVGMDHYTPITQPGLQYCEVGAIWRAGAERGIFPLTIAEMTEDIYRMVSEKIGFHSRIFHKFNDSWDDAWKSIDHLRQLARVRYSKVTGR